MGNNNSVKRISATLEVVCFLGVFCVYTFHVCLFLLALTFACNSTYLLKLEVQRYDSKQHDALKALSHVAIFLAICNAILLLRDANY